MSLRFLLIAIAAIAVSSFASPLGWPVYPNFLEIKQEGFNK
jgi:hypothetical protein